MTNDDGNSDQISVLTLVDQVLDSHKLGTLSIVSLVVKDSEQIWPPECQYRPLDVYLEQDCGHLHL